MNIAILYFTGEVFTGKDANGNKYYRVSNKFQSYVKAQDPEFWTPVAVLLLAIAIEHGLLGLKILIAAFIPDVPSDVEDRERKREILRQQAQQDLQEYKLRNNALSFEDIKQELAKEQAANAGKKEMWKQIKQKGQEALKKMQREIDKQHKN
jgi:hypothetical protein